MAQQGREGGREGEEAAWCCCCLCRTRLLISMGREERNEMEEGGKNEMRGVGQEKRCLCVMTISMKNGE